MLVPAGAGVDAAGLIVAGVDAEDVITVISVGASATSTGASAGAEAADVGTDAGADDGVAREATGVVLERGKV